MQNPGLSPLKTPPRSARYDVALDPSKAAPPPLVGPRTVGGPLGGAGSAFGESIERRTLRQGVVGALFEGLFGGLCSMNVYVAIKAMGDEGGRWESEISTLMHMLPSILMAFALFYSAGGKVRKRRDYWLAVAFGGRLIVAAVALFTNPWFFVALVAIQAIASAGIAPALNHVWGANCSPAARGRIFTWYSVVAEVATMGGSLVAAVLLDGFHFAGIDLDGSGENYRILYPVAGVIGFAGMIWFWRIRLRFAPTHADDARRTPWRERTAQAFKQVGRLFKRDPDFRLYEIGFLLYGTAFMMVLPTVPLLYKNSLDASYAEFSAGTVVLVQVMHLVMAPIIVRVARRRRVTVVTRIPFVVLTLYPVLLSVVALAAPHNRDLAMAAAYGAFVVFGIGMAFIHFVWNLGPVAFARGQNPLPYTSTHAALVGLRASVGFPISYALIKIFDGQPLPVFALAACLFVAAAVVMTRLDHRLRTAASPSSRYDITQ